MSKSTLSSKTVLITGAAHRVGAATARYLHQQGMNIVIHYFTSQLKAVKLMEELNSLRAGSAALLQADLTSKEALSPLITQAVTCFGDLDVLVNNASQFYPTPFGNITETQWDDLINSNFKAPLFLSQAAAPFLAKTKGCIINIIDIHSERPLKDYSVYCSAKAGLAMLTKALAKELGPSVRVNGVSPGAVAWPEGINALDEKMKQKIIDSTLLKRCGSPEDIANTIHFLISNADYITGQILNVDGGRSLNLN